MKQNIIQPNLAQTLAARVVFEGMEPYAAAETYYTPYVLSLNMGGVHPSQRFARIEEHLKQTAQLATEVAYRAARLDF